MNNRNTAHCPAKAGEDAGKAEVVVGKRYQARTVRPRPCSSPPAAVSDPPQALLVDGSATTPEKSIGIIIPFSCMANVCKICQSKKKWDHVDHVPILASKRKENLFLKPPKPSL